jgi:hypothetical protein
VPVWLALIALGLRRDRHLGRREPALLLCWCAIPPALLYGYSLACHPLVGPVRYVLFIAPAYLLLVARGLVALPAGARRVAALACFAAAGTTLCGTVYDPTFEFKHDWRGVAAVIQVRDPRAEVVFLRYFPRGAPPKVDLNEVTLRYYLGPRAAVQKVYLDSTVVPTGADRNALWLVDGARDHCAIHVAIARQYDVATSKRLGALRVTYYRRRPPEAFLTEATP